MHMHLMSIDVLVKAREMNGELERNTGGTGGVWGGGGNTEYDRENARLSSFLVCKLFLAARNVKSNLSPELNVCSVLRQEANCK